jgi:hypothetical protein
MLIITCGLEISDQQQQLQGIFLTSLVDVFFFGEEICSFSPLLVTCDGVSTADWKKGNF